MPLLKAGGITDKGTAGMGSSRTVVTGRRDAASITGQALVGAIMVLLLTSIAQFGLMFERQVGLNNTAGEGARRDATQPTTSANAATNAAWTLDELQTALANSQAILGDCVLPIVVAVEHRSLGVQHACIDWARSWQGRTGDNPPEFTFGVVTGDHVRLLARSR